MIKVPLKVTYGILTVLDLALRFGASPVQAKVIARRQGIPARFIEQILHSLKQGRIIESLRGPQGGYSLRRSPAQVSLADIVEAMNGPFFSGPSSNGGINGRQDRQNLHSEALLTSIWDRVHQAEHEILNSITFQDLVESYEQLEQKRVPMYHI